MSGRRPSPPRRTDAPRDYDRDWRSSRPGGSSRQRSVSPPYSRGPRDRRDGRDTYRDHEPDCDRDRDRDRDWDRERDRRSRPPPPPRDDGRSYRKPPAPYESSVPPARDSYDDRASRYDDRDRDRYARRSGRRRSRSRSRSPPPPPRGHGPSSSRPERRHGRRDDDHSTANDPGTRHTRAKVDESAADGEDGEVQDDAADGPTDDDMMAMMGFGGFGTTKGKKIAGNEAGAAEIKKERTWRQYMNRKGGFNRPLDKI